MKLNNQFVPFLQRKFGNVFGIYNGYYPTVVVMEPEIIKNILVKDFSNFTDRGRFIGPTPAHLLEGIFFMKGSKWKRIRNTVSPIFSANKLKQMVPLLTKCCCDLAGVLEKEVGQTVRIKEHLGRFSMDTISSATFGLDLEPHTNPDHPLMKSMQAFMRPSKLAVASFLLSAMIPPIRDIFLLLGISFWNKDASDYFEETGKKLIADRKANRADRPDFIQYMLDAEFNTTTAEHGDHCAGTNFDSDQMNILRLSDREINSTAFTLFFGGYETTSSLLTVAAHILSTRQDLDQRLYDEICAELGDEEPTYETLGQLRFMEMFMLETLRFYPPVCSLDRVAKEDYPIGNGMTIPRGCRIQVPLFYLHHSEDLYEKPTEFDPDRFSADQKTLDSVKYLPFGFGPHHCVGMRFARVVIKLALVNILRQVRFVRCDQTQEALDIVVGGLLRTKSPVIVGLEKRTEASTRQ